MSVNILFYSKTCHVSKSLLQILQSENLINMFVLHCVDGQLDKLPPQIKMVPTMIVKNIPNPIVAHDTFKWVEHMKFLRVQSSQPVQPVQLPPPPTTATTDKLLLGYRPEEMTGISDEFTYLNTDMALPHAYQRYKEDSTSIFTAPELNKLRKDELASKIKDITSERDKQAEAITEITRTQQAHALLKLDKEQIVNTSLGQKQILMQEQQRRMQTLQHLNQKRRF